MKALTGLSFGAIMLFSLLAGCEEKMFPEKLSVFPEKENKVFYAATVTVPGLPKDSVFARAKYWLVSLYNRKMRRQQPVKQTVYDWLAAMTLRTDDPVNGQLETKLSFMVPFDSSRVALFFVRETVSWQVSCWVHIAAAASSYSYSFDQFSAVDEEEREYWYKGEPHKFIVRSTIPVSNQMKMIDKDFFGIRNISNFYTRIDSRVKEMIASLDTCVHQYNHTNNE